MTFEGYLQLHTMCTIAEQVVLVTLFCEILAILWGDENAKVSSFFCQALLGGVYVMTDIVCAMGPVMTGLTYAVIISFTIKLMIIAINLSVTIRHHKLVKRCKKACRQNQQQPLSAEDICRICQTYCRQIRQKNNY